MPLILGRGRKGHEPRDMVVSSSGKGREQICPWMPQKEPALPATVIFAPQDLLQTSDLQSC